MPKGTRAPPFSRTPTFSRGAVRRDIPTEGLGCSACSTSAGGLSGLAKGEPLVTAEPSSHAAGQQVHVVQTMGRIGMCLHIRVKVKHKSGPVFAEIIC